MSIKPYRPYLYAGAVIILLIGLWIQNTEIRDLSEKNEQALAAVRDSLKNVQTELAAAKNLHLGKLWFAAKASNWELAQYEFDELSETMESAKSLHAVKNGVNISNVLDSVLQTQIAQLDESIRRQNQSDFQKAYDETRSACNGCHEQSGHKFIHIVGPTAPPVTNQSWIQLR